MRNQTTLSSTPYEILYAFCRERKYCDVLIDRMGGFPFEDEVAAHGNHLVEKFVLNDPLFAASPEQAPLLLRVRLEEIDLLEKYLTLALQESSDSECQTRTVCGFLFSSLKLEELGKLLTKKLDVHVQTIGSIYFRYFDPRVIHHLPRILSADQFAALLRGVQSWLYVNWIEQLNIVVPSLLTQELIHRPNLSIKQWQQMQNIESYNMAMRTLQRNGFLFNKAAASVEKQLLAAICQAEDAQLDKSADQAIFAVYALQLGTAFTQCSSLDNVIEVVTRHNIPLADALDAHFGLTPEFIPHYQIPDLRAKI